MLQNFNRERVSERLVHANSSGAYGTFTTTHDIVLYTKANIINKVGKTTGTFVRFWTVGGERGGANTVRDPRGFAVRCFTEKGNWDLMVDNMPIFIAKDPIVIVL